MYYEINVALNNRHFFATHERSLTNEDAAKKALEIFKGKFPASEGYEVSVTYWECKGKTPKWSLT